MADAVEMNGESPVAQSAAGIVAVRPSVAGTMIVLETEDETANEIVIAAAESGMGAESHTTRSVAVTVTASAGRVAGAPTGVVGPVGRNKRVEAPGRSR